MGVFCCIGCNMWSSFSLFAVFAFHQSISVHSPSVTLHFPSFTLHSHPSQLKQTHQKYF